MKRIWVLLKIDSVETTIIGVYEKRCRAEEQVEKEMKFDGGAVYKIKGSFLNDEVATNDRFRSINL